MFIDKIILAVIAFVIIYFQICTLGLLISIKKLLPTAKKNEEWYRQQIAEKDKQIGDLRLLRDGLARQNSAYRKIFKTVKEDELHRMGADLDAEAAIRNPSGTQEE